jgi:large subunit ribosomal protein L30
MTEENKTAPTEKPEMTEKPAKVETAPVAKPKPVAKPAQGGKVAVILIRGTVRATSETEHTLQILKLRKKNTCVVVERTDSIMGLINKVKDYVAYGTIDDATVKLLQEKRGQKDKDGKIKNHFHLSPPRGGFERKGIKRTYEQGGAAGNRRGKISDLIKKMI